MLGKKELKSLKNELKDNCTRVVKSLSKKSPIIIPVIIDINGEDL